MTGASIKEIGSLLNFVGSGQVTQTKTEGGSGFGDVMSKTTGSEGKPQTEVKPGKEQKDLTPRDNVKIHSPKRDAVKVSPAKKAVTEEGVTDEQVQVLEEAAGQMLQNVAEELNVSIEEVQAAMETLGLEEISLLEEDTLPALVLQISGEESVSLLTDENLYGAVQELTGELDTLKEEVVRELDIRPEELETVLDEISRPKEPEITEQAAVPEETTIQPEKTKIIVEEKGETVELTTDARGNITQAETVKPEEAAREDTPDQEKKESHDEGKGRSELIGENQTPHLSQDLKTDEVQKPFEEMVSYETPDTQEIMDQIMDYMKVSLKPEMDQIEMQLHPASLGMLRIQLTNRGGEVTAQFQVQNEAVKEAIEGQLTILKDTLREQGVKVEAVEVTVESHGFESNLWQGQERNEENAYQGSRRTPRRINLNALDEGFEEEADEEALLAAEMMRANGGTVDYTA